MSASSGRGHVRENLSLALETLRSHKFRSFLTVLGVLIGVTTLVGVASVISGLDNQFTAVADEFGTRSIFIFKWTPGINFHLTREERLRKPLTYDDGMAIRDQCPDVEAVGVQAVNWGNPAVVKYRNAEMLGGQLVGETPDAMRVGNTNVAEGRSFNEADDLHRRNVAVIGADVTQRLFGNLDPIGKTILVNGTPIQVIGAAAKHKSFLGDTGRDRTVAIPYWTYMKLYPQTRENFILAEAYPGRMTQAIDEIVGVLRIRRHVKPWQKNNFGYSTAESIISQWHQITGMIGLVLVVISSIGLMVGGIGVMNIMLVSVTERTREIGVRKAIGARRSDITWQFLLEAMTLTGGGGLLGVAVGYFMSFSVRILVPSVPSAVPLWAPIVGFVVAVSIGLFFGMWPALKAARLDPIVALRYE